MPVADPLLGHGRQIIVREDWLRLTAEPILEPGLPIIDPHHHLWQRAEGSYLLPDLLGDTGSGHDIRGTIFVQCGEMYRAAGPVEEQSLGETEFVTGVAAVSASGRHGPTRACAGIIGMVDLTLGDKVDALLEAHRAVAGARFCGIRNRTAWHPSPEVTSNLVSPPPGPLENPAFADGARRLARHGLPLDVWCYHTQLPHVVALARAVPELTIVVDHVGGPLGIGPFAGRQAEVFPEWKQQMLDTGGVAQRRGQAGRPHHVCQRLRLPPPAEAAGLGGAGEDLAALYRDLHRGVRRQPLHVRKQLPGRQGHVQLSGAVERAEAPGRRRQRRGEERAVQRHRPARLSPRPPARGALGRPLGQIGATLALSIHLVIK